MEEQFHAFQQALIHFSHYDEALWKALRPHSRIRRLHKNAILSAQSFDAFLVTKGILSLEATESDRIIHFISPGCIVPDSYLESNLCYHVQEEAILITVPLHTLEEVHRKYPGLYHLEKDIIANWMRMINYGKELLDMDKHLRKRRFKELFPGVPGNIPNVVIARYLAISREYFGKTDW